MLAEVPEVRKDAEPRNSGKDQRDEKQDPFGAFKVGMLSPDHVATLRCDADPRSGLP